MSSPMSRVHASCVALGDAAVLLRGPSGSGKSDLALRLIDAGAQLVADDQTELTAADGRLLAAAPAALAGLIEVRGVGVLRLERHRGGVPVRLVVDLVPATAVERLPVPEVATLLAVTLPRVALAAFEASAAAKVRLALRFATSDIMPPL